VSRLRVGQPMFDSRHGLVFLLATTSRLVLGPSQPPIQGTPWSFIREQNGRGVKLTIHLHLAPRLKCLELYFHSPIRLHGVVI